MYEIINLNILMLHFVIFHNVTRYNTSLLSHIRVNTTKHMEGKLGEGEGEEPA